MSSSHPHDPLPLEGERIDPSKLARRRFLLLAIGGIGLIVSIIIFFTPWGPKYAYSWLFGFYYFFSLALGGLFWTLLHNATNSGWGIAVRRVFENLACVIPFMALLVIPLLVPGVRDSLYEWSEVLTEIEATLPAEGEAEVVDAAAGESAHEVDPLEHALHEAAKEDPHLHLLVQKYPYLNKPFFYFRVVFYFVVLSLIALVLRRWSTRQDDDGKVKWTLRARRFSCGFLPLFAICTTFAAIDFLMALDYAWFSTMWGVYLFAGAAMNGMAVSILTVMALKRMGYLKLVNQEHYHTMGKLLFAFVVFWAYIGFSQYFLIWYANIPEETKFFLIRNTENWNVGSTALMWVHFVAPFVFLLPAWVKKNSKLMPIACVWILAAHFLDYYLIVIPERFISLASPAEMMAATSPSYPWAFLLDLLAFITVGALSLWYFLGTFTGRRLYPCRDPRLHETVHLAN